MLTPMLVQYVVGLCCVRANPEAVDITLGDMILDEATEKTRDIDITVRYGGRTEVFKAYEVKRESKPLDVGSVEQLCSKMKDMPSVTHRHIVSASGYSDGAIKKAKHHGVTLYTLKDWSGELGEQFPAFASKTGTTSFHWEFLSPLLYWVDFKSDYQLENETQPGVLKNSDSIRDQNGNTHKKFHTLFDFHNQMCLRSTQILCNREPAKTVKSLFGGKPTDELEFLAGPRWHYAHTMDIRKFEAHLINNNQLTLLTDVTFAGELQWRTTRKYPSSPLKIG